MEQYYSVLKYQLSRLHKDTKPQDKTIRTGTGVNLAPTIFLPRNSKDKVGKESTPDTLIMDNLETLLYTTVDKVRGNSSGSIV